MIYCEGVECKTELGKKVQRFRCDRPDEWTMDVIIGEVDRVVSAKDARIAELESRLEYAAETFDILDDHTHPNIECDAVAAACRELINKGDE